MEQVIADLPNQVGTIRQELSGVTNMNIPTFIRTIDARIQNIEGIISSIGNIDQTISDKIRMAEKRLKDQFGSQGGWKNKPILECRAIQDLKALIDGKGYRIWNKKFKNALEQARPKSREVITWLETIKEKRIIETKGDDLDDTMGACIMTIAESETWKQKDIRGK